MKMLVVAIFVLFSPCSSEDADAVVEYDDTNWSTGSFDTALVMFHASWCPHSIELIPNFQRAAKIMKEIEPSLQFISVDCAVPGRGTCTRYKIPYYPLLKVFRHTHGSLDIKSYNGSRDVTGMVKYMTRQIGPKEILSPRDMDEFLAIARTTETAVVGFFKKEADKPDLEAAFFEVVDILREKLDFAYTSNEKVLASEALYWNEIVLYRAKNILVENVDFGYTADQKVWRRERFLDQFDIYRASYDDWREKDCKPGPDNADDILRFVLRHVHGIVGSRTMATATDYKPPLMVLYLSSRIIDSPIANHWHKRILKVAENFRGSITFAISPLEEFLDELEDYGVAENVQAEIDTIVLARDSKKRKFKLEGNITSESLEEFADAFLNGKLVPYWKSEPLPVNNDKEVKSVVANNFEDMVLANTNDVFVEFYGLDCSVCRSLFWVLDEVAEKIANDSVVILKMDASQNDIPFPFEAKKIPSFYFVSKNATSPLKYRGSKTSEEILMFIAKYATEELQGFDRHGRPKDNLRFVKSEL